MIYKLLIYFSIGYFVSVDATPDLGVSGFIHMFGLCCGADPSQTLRSVDFWFIV